MGMMRKMTSLSSAGLVSYHSPSEKKANAAAKEARASMKVARAEAKLLKAQRKALKGG